MECPYCSKNFEIPDVAYINIESYGSRTCNIKCNHCGKVVQVYGTVTVRFGNPIKTNSQSDW